MKRILLVTTFAIAVPAFSQAQQSNEPVIERTESIIYEKRVTEKRQGNSAVNAPATPPSPNQWSPPTADGPVLRGTSTIREYRTGQPGSAQSVRPIPVETADPAAIQSLRTLLEAQGRQIDSIQQELLRQKNSALTAEIEPNQPKAPKAIKRDHVSIGVYVGPNFSKYSTDQDSLDSKARVGYQIGAYVRGGGRLFGQLGVEYVGVSSKLYSKDDKGTSLNQISSTINTHYVQVPVQIGFRPAMTPSKRTGIRIQAGGELSYLLNTDKNDLKLTDDDFNKTVINLIGGIGFDLGPFTLDVSYHHGIKDAYKNENAKLRMLSASVGFKF